VLDKPVGVRFYRQLSIGITEKHVKEVFRPFNRHDDTGSGADLNAALAWQSGHRPLLRADNYGLDGAFPTKLQPSLLRVYEWASTRWHEFLYQPSKAIFHTDETKYIAGIRTRRIIEQNGQHLLDVDEGSSDVEDVRPVKRRVLSREWKQSESTSARPKHQRHISISSDSTGDSCIESDQTDFDWGGEESDASRLCQEEHCSEPLDQAQVVKQRRTTQLHLEPMDAPITPAASSDLWPRAKAIMEATLEKARFKEQRDTDQPDPYVEPEWLKRRMEYVRKKRSFSDEKSYELKQQLERWSNRCPLCHLRREAEQRHRLQDCSRDEARQIWRNLEHMRSRVRLCESNFCFHCGLKDSPWDSAIHFLPHHEGGWQGFRPGMWRCQYEGLILSVIVTILQECEDDGIVEEVYGWMREYGIEIKSEREVFLWLTCKNIMRKGDWGHGWDVFMVHRVFHQLARAVK
jgi:hypothetical protein